MFKKVLLLTVASAVASTGWTQEMQNESRASKQERIGLGSGAVIGAAAGGPLGFVLGAAFGGWLGDRFADEKEQRLVAEARFAQAEAETDELEKLLARNERETARLESQLMAERQTHARALEEALNVDVYFRTGQAELDDGAAERLLRIGEMISPMDGVAVLLEGHADARGDEEYNAALSAQRAETVREIFIQAGVPADRIAVSAEGEALSEAIEGDIDALALERRVEISIVGPAAPERVAQHNVGQRATPSP